MSVTEPQRMKMCPRRHPAATSPEVAATASGTFEMKTAASMATLTAPPLSSVSPITADSGIPSSTMPRTIASGEPSACSPPELFRAAPPMRSITASPSA